MTVYKLQNVMYIFADRGIHEIVYTNTYTSLRFWQPSRNIAVFSKITHSVKRKFSKMGMPTS